MYYPTSIGLDVHLSSISAAALNAETGEVISKTFGGDDIEGIVKWAKSLDGPVQAVYESGFCGFTLQRALEKSGVICKIAAISKLAKPAGDKVKTDKRDAIFLARQLTAGNIVAVHVPGIHQEGMRDISRTLATIRDNLTATKLRVSQTHHRYGLRYYEKGGSWTVQWLSWAKALQLPTEPAQIAYNCHLTQALTLQEEKRELSQVVESWCVDETIKDYVNAFCALKGISKTIAFSLAVEIGNFSRFKSSAAFTSYLGLVPSESSSGKSVSRGGITHTGNEHVRKCLIEASWCYARMNNAYKKPVAGLSPTIVALGAKANRRLLQRRRYLKKAKQACVANAATARELATWIWSIGREVERERS